MIAHNILFNKSLPKFKTNNLKDREKYESQLRSRYSSILFAYFEPDATHDMLEDKMIGLAIGWNRGKGKQAEKYKSSTVIRLENECTKDGVHKSS